MFVVDTNVLYYAADADAPEHNVCRALVEKWRAQVEPWFTTWNVLYELLRISTHPRVMRKPLSGAQALSYVESLLASPSLRVLSHTEQHASLLVTTLREIPLVRGNLFFDVHTAVLMREHGIRRIYSRDTDFHRFPFLEVIDPLAPLSA